MRWLRQALRPISVYHSTMFCNLHVCPFDDNFNFTSLFNQATLNYTFITIFSDVLNQFSEHCRNILLNHVLALYPFSEV